MRTFLVIGCLLLLSSFNDPQEALVGTWLTEDQKSKVEIYQKGDEYFGKIVWLAKGTDRKGNPVVDKKNPEKSLRKRPILGIEMIQNLQYRNGKWVGKLYAPKSGRTVDATIELVGQNNLKLVVSYYSFSKTQNWTRDS